MKYLIFICLFISTFLFGQNIEVTLDSLSTLDDGDFHLTLLSDTLKEKLLFPPVDSNKLKYFTLFYSWKTTNDQEISVLVDEQQDRDIIYVDKNNDENLNNDGNPVIFFHSENKLYIDINSEPDPKQTIKLVIYRIPPIADSLRPKYFDSSGNLNPAFAKWYGGLMHDSTYKGEIGTFYCEDRVTLRRSKIELEGIKYDVGLFDYSNNGIYTDDDDLLIIDLDRDGKLKYYEQTEVFKLTDVIRIGELNYELAYVDKYGKNFILTKTNNNPTDYFLQYMQEQSSQLKQKNIISPVFWESIFTSLYGKSIEVKDFRGKYIFINIWGEWCLACIEEIPELKKAYDAWKEKVVFLSILKTLNLDKAKELISKEEINWPQIVMNSEIEGRLKINSYPINILIYPDGETYLKEGQINQTFFNLNIK